MTDSNDKNREGLDIVRQVKSYQKELDARNLIRQFPTNQNVPNNNGIHLLAFMLVSLVILVGGIVLVKSSKVDPVQSPAATAAPSVPVVPSGLGISPQ